MSTDITIICLNSNTTISVAMGTTLQELAQMCKVDCKYPILASLVNNRLKPLSYRVYRPITIRFIDITHFAGVRIYQSTLSFVMQRTIEELYPEHKLHIRHSIGASGLYCEIDGIKGINKQALGAIETRMREIVEANLEIGTLRLPTEQVRNIYLKRGYNDKVALLDSRPRLYSTISTLGNTVGYFYEPLAISTRQVAHFGISSYCNGIYISIPLREHPEELSVAPKPEKMFDIFQEYQSWVDIMGVPTVGELNHKVLKGDTSELVKIAEAFHERKIASMADSIATRNKEQGTRMVLLSGPSSSGKTTTAKRLGIHLQVLGLKPVLISLDDYFVDRESTPKDENGEYDFEALEAIDLKLFNSDLQQLFSGESVEIPRYDFISGTRKWHDNPLTLDKESILIVEGIHGLNPKLTPSIAENLKFKIYVSCITSVAMDNCTRISTTDNRLLRRLTRDYTQRGSSGISTLSRWGSVRRGEERHIFPYQENADVIFNSSLFYEISVLRSFAEPILHEIPDTLPEYSEARRMLKFLDNFTPIAPDEIPPTSILREFISGSSFKY